MSAKTKPTNKKTSSLNNNSWVRHKAVTFCSCGQDQTCAVNFNEPSPTANTIILLWLCAMTMEMSKYSSPMLPMESSCITGMIITNNSVIINKWPIGGWSVEIGKNCKRSWWHLLKGPLVVVISWVQWRCLNWRVTLKTRKWITIRNGIFSALNWSPKLTNKPD